MTAASELKSAAVVQQQAQPDSRKRKTTGPTAVEVEGAVKVEAVVGSAVVGSAVVEGAVAINAASKNVTEVRNEAGRNTAEQVQAAHGSTTADATQPVAAAHETSGSSAATASKAASIQATRLPVSVFSRIHESSQLSSRIQYHRGLAGHGARRAQLVPGDRAAQAYR